ncbi:MAG: hypothetical protein ACLPH3_02565 [Terracidiphilus sp.]
MKTLSWVSGLAVCCSLGLCLRGNAQTVVGNVVESNGTGYPLGSNPAYFGVDFGYNNFVFGPYAGHNITTGRYNMALGQVALQHATTTSEDTAVGYGALSHAVSANYATAVGYEALASLVGTGPEDANESVAVGHQAEAYATGNDNVGIGPHSLIAVTGDRNVAMGTDSGAAGMAHAVAGPDNGWLINPGLWSGSDNTMIGHDAMSGWTWNLYLQGDWTNDVDVTGNMNSCLGEACLEGLTTASNNVAAGYRALASNSTGNDNVAIGYYAGVTDESANQDTSGSQNVWVGRESGASTPTQLDNCVAVGYRSKCDSSNEAVIGNSMTTKAIVHGDPHFWSVFVAGQAYQCGSTADGNAVGTYPRCGYLSLPMAMTVTQISFSFGAGGLNYGWLPSYTVYDGTNKCSVQWTQSGGVAQPTTGVPTGSCTFAAGANLAIVMTGEYGASQDAYNANITVTLVP